VGGPSVGGDQVTTIEAREVERKLPAGGRAPERPVPGVLRIAGLASLAAGAIHATAAGAHSEHRGVVVAFAVLAALQIGWGALAQVRSGLVVSAAGIGVNAAALAGWVLAKTSGIGFIEGLDVQEDPQFADTLSAALAAVAIAGAALALAAGAHWIARPRPVLVGVAAVAAIGLVVPGMVSTGSHSHADGGHGDDDHAHTDGAESAAAGEHDHTAMQAATPKPYDATLPVDLSGTPGVTMEQQREAEDLVTRTLEELPQFSDYADVTSRGWNSIGDGFFPGAFEHVINWPLIDDDVILDPSQPETLVFRNDGNGQKTLVAAMFQLPRGVGLDEVPDIGGGLVQWHIHDDLCFAGAEGAWRVAGVAPPPAPCRPGTFRFEDPSPMVHVWIVPHECGPFAALEGIGGGQIAPGEERLCDHAHGAPA
jgi:hypothetical protein